MATLHPPLTSSAMRVSKEDGPIEKLSERETASLAALFCGFWFAANWSVNKSLEWTSVGSSTILASMSGFFTLGECRVFRLFMSVCDTDCCLALHRNRKDLRRRDVHEVQAHCRFDIVSLASRLSDIQHSTRLFLKHLFPVSSASSSSLSRTLSASPRPFPQPLPFPTSLLRPLSTCSTYPSTSHHPIFASGETPSPSSRPSAMLSTSSSSRSRSERSLE
jgi:hypothetical protein